MAETPSHGSWHGWLFGVLLLAALVRVVGIGYGLPLDLVPDESALILAGVTMLSLRTLVPALHPDAFSMLYYPPLIPYLNALAFLPVLAVQYRAGSFGSFEVFRAYLAERPESLWLTARALQVGVGTATVWLVAKIGSRLGGPRLGLAAAAFLALSFTHVVLSHFGKQWIVTVFLMTLVLWGSLAWSMRAGRMALLGAIAGLAFGANIAGGFAWLIVAGVWWYRNRAQGLRSMVDGRLLLATLVCAAVAGLCVGLHWPYFHWLFTRAMRSGAYITWHEPKSLPGYLGAFGYMASILAMHEPVLAIFALIGAAVLLRQGRRAAVAGVAALSISYITYLYICVHLESRYVVLLLPAFALLAGYGLHAAASSALARRHARWMSVGIALLFGINGVWIARLDWLLTQPDTRLLARTWIEANARGACFLLSSGTSGVHVRRTDEAIALQDRYGTLRMGEADRLRRMVPGSRARPGEALAVNIQEWNEPSRTLAVVRKLVDQQRDAGRRVYAVVNYWTASTLSPLDHALLRDGRLVQRFENGVGDAQVVHDFSQPLTVLFRMRRLGTTVDIYELAGG